MKNYDAALEVCQQALKVLFKREYAHVFRAMVIQKQSGIGQALDDIDAAIMLAPKDPEILVLCGAIFFTAHDYQKAVDAYTNALKLKPNDASVFAIRGICYAYLGQRDEAMQDFARGIEVNRFDPTPYNNRAFVLAKD
jgi:Flp pilus assembly protein TadD